MKPAASVEDVADAILDGAPVDWNGIDSRPEETDQALVKQLKTLAALRLVTRRSRLPAPSAPAEWGHLRVLERVGHGAFGEVYRAWDTRLDREVALKLLPDSLSGDSPESSIIEEGRLLARVRHPNVVTIYGAERIDGRIGLWMELVTGRTLEETLRDGPAFTAKEVTRIGVELCRAVSAVHAAGLLHRDIKAQNVMVADDGRLVLMDFGTGREVLSSETHVAGTPLYLAPEVLSGAAATPQSEVYSIGVLLYHLLTGAYPVQGRDLTYLRRAHAAREEAGPGTAGPKVPPRLGRVIARAIDPDPNRRYASADALGAAIAALERAPSALRPAYALAAGVAVIAVGWMAWGQRDLFGLKSPTAAPINAETAAAIVDTPVILVLPFKNDNPEKDSDFFVDGFTSEVIRNLSPPLIDGLQVRSQTSSFWFKDKERNLAMIGEQLGVTHIVEGDVLRVGKQLRVNARLVQIAGDTVLWADTFPRTVEDVFTIQGEIALMIANKLRLTLGKGQRNYRTSVRAYDLYLKALAVRPGRGEGRGPEAAINLFEQAIAIDSTFAPAFAGLAGTHQTMAWNIGTAVSPSIRPAAVRALELDPRLAEAEAAMVTVYADERDWPNATKSFKRALELNPNLPQAYAAYSEALVLMGQPKLALQMVEQARTLDPHSLIVQRDLAIVQFFNGDFEDAIATAQQVVAADPEVMPDIVLGRALTLAGRHEEAIAVWRENPVDPPNGGWERWLARAYVITGRPEEVDRLLSDPKNQDPFHQAIIYAGRRDKDRTFEALNGAAADSRTPALVRSPETAFLRGDSRLDVLKKKMKLPVER